MTHAVLRVIYLYLALVSTTPLCLSALFRYKAHQNAFTLIPKAQILEYYKHTFQTLFVVFAEMFAHKMTSSPVKHTAAYFPQHTSRRRTGDYRLFSQDYDGCG